MRIAFIGAGAVGGWFGGRLLEAGHEVAYVARGATLEALRRQGLVLNGAAGRPVSAVPSAAELGDCDVIFLTVKATRDTDLRALLDGAPDAPVAVTLNAVEAPGRVAEVVGRHRTWPGVVRGFFHHVGPGRVDFRGGPASYVFGTFDGTPHPLADRLARELTSAGIESRVHPQVWLDLWEKAMFVTCFGALGALTSQPLGALRTAHRRSLRALMEEVFAVAVAAGVELDGGTVDRVMAFADRMPATATSSMQRDLAAGTTGELDAQVGAICRLGAAHSVDVRLHDLLLDVLAPDLARG